MRCAMCFSVLLASVTTAHAQQLFTFAEPAGPVAVQSAATAVVDVPGDVGEVPIVVDIDMLRTRPQSLVMPGDDPKVVHLRHFEDRGNGDLLWRGGSPASPYADTVLTVANDHLVGSYMDADGWRELRAGPSGSGSLSTAAHDDRDGDWCPHAPQPWTRPGADLPLPVSGALRKVRSATSDDDDDYTHVVDVVFGYGEGVREKLIQLGNGDMGVAVQSYFDFANTVLDNTFGEKFLKIRNVNTRKIFDSDGSITVKPYDLASEHINRIHAFRHAYDADLVAIVTDNRYYDLARICGIAPIYHDDINAEDMSHGAFFITDMGCEARSAGRSKRTFIHELGHNLGLHHNVEIQQDELPVEWLRHSNGHGYWGNPWATDKAVQDSPKPTKKKPGIFTIMSYKPSSYLDGTWVELPFFSNADATVSSGSYGLPQVDGSDYDWPLGDTDRWADGESAVRQTGADIAGLSQYQYDLPFPPTSFRISSATKDESANTMTFTFKWWDGSDDEIAFQVYGSAHEPSKRLGIPIPGKALRDIAIRQTHGDYPYDASTTEDKTATVTWPLHNRDILVFTVQAASRQGPTLSEPVIFSDWADFSPRHPPRKPEFGTVFEDVEINWQEHFCVGLSYEPHPVISKLVIHFEEVRTAYGRSYRRSTSRTFRGSDINKSSAFRPCFGPLRSPYNYEYKIWAEVWNSVGSTRSDTFTHTWTWR